MVYYRIKARRDRPDQASLASASSAKEPSSVFSALDFPSLVPALRSYDLKEVVLAGATRPHAVAQEVAATLNRLYFDRTQTYQGNWLLGLRARRRQKVPKTLGGLVWP